MFNINNYFLATRARFVACIRPKRKPDFTSNESEYWYTDKGVIRCSNHWSRVYSSCKNDDVIECHRVKSCYWILITNKKGARLTGFCEWSNFKPNNKRCGK